VTLLTSLDQDILSRELGIETPVSDMTVRLALLAKSAGLDGVVASPREIRLIKDACGTDFLVVTPGIRPAWTTKDDQKRTDTPGEAVKAGADYLVIGRPIRGADNRREAAEKILKEISGVRR
jgi:orotidine-5'-phosphate decarboxylase